MFQSHQGDVYIRQIKSIPSNVKPVDEKGDVILAHGEVTGHAHRIMRGAIMFRADEGIGTYLEVKTGADVTHEEHATVSLPAGLYEVVVQSQYTPQAIRNVED